MSAPRILAATSDWYERYLALREPYPAFTLAGAPVYLDETLRPDALELWAAPRLEVVRRSEDRPRW